MKKLLLLTVALLSIAGVATADHIGIYTDATGSSCSFVPGFTTTPTIIHKFSAGTTGSRFKVTFPAGSSFFAFNTPFSPLGVLNSDISVGYGTCLNGSIPIGTIIAILAAGLMQVEPADLYSFILFTDCNFVELVASGGGAIIGSSGGECTNPVQPSTWGKVKSLYR
jgi:hypothetical protein